MEAIIVALIGLAGSAVGSILGVLASARLTTYRLEQLVQAHNNLIERTYKLEERTEIQEEKIKVANHRIEDLEKKVDAA